MTVPATPGLEWLSTSRESNMRRRATEEAALVRWCVPSRTLLWHLDLRSRLFLVKVKQKSSDSLHVRGLQIKERRLQEVPPAVLGRTARREAANS